MGRDQDPDLRRGCRPGDQGTAGFARWNSAGLAVWIHSTKPAPDGFENDSGRTQGRTGKAGKVKQSDIEQADRLLHIVSQLTAEECSSVEIMNDNPDFNGLPACCVTVHRLGDGIEMIDEDFRADTVLECLRLAMVRFGITEDPGETSSIFTPESFNRCEKCGCRHVPEM